tara:strand:- start:1499 stop:1753 length:255 start_codon:yes stop_codon:yes gene_type:complete
VAFFIYLCLKKDMFKVLLNIIESTIPLAGEVIEQVKSPEGGQGKFKLTPRFVKQVIRLVVAVGVIYMAIKGTISLDEAQDIIKQ